MASSKSSAMESLKAVTSMDRKPTGCLVLETKGKRPTFWLSDFQSHGSQIAALRKWKSTGILFNPNFKSMENESLFFCLMVQKLVVY